MLGQRTALLLTVALATWSIPHLAAAQRVYAYPNAGQSEAEQSRDRFECHQWAVAQTGFDPSTAAPVQAAPTPPPDPSRGYSDRRVAQQRDRGFLGIGDGGFFEGGGMMGDAATGAALGAAGGAIAGDAGQGAAIGAVASTLFGALSRSSTPRQQQAPARDPNQDYYRQQQAAADRAHGERVERAAEYNRAYGACMASRDYTVN